jgi:hypothetical protein
MSKTTRLSVFEGGRKRRSSVPSVPHCVLWAPIAQIKVGLRELGGPVASDITCVTSPTFKMSQLHCDGRRLLQIRGSLEPQVWMSQVRTIILLSSPQYTPSPFPVVAMSVLAYITGVSSSPFSVSFFPHLVSRSAILRSDFFYFT